MEFEGDSAYCYNAIREYRKALEEYKTATEKIALHKEKRDELLKKLENTRTITPELHAKGFVEVNGELRNCNMEMSCSNNISLYENGECNPKTGEFCFSCNDVESPYSGSVYHKKCKCQHGRGCCTIGLKDCKEFSTNGKLNQSILAQEINPQIEALDVAIKSEKLKIRELQLVPDCNPFTLDSESKVKPPTDANSPTFYEDGIKFYNAVLKVLPDIPEDVAGLSPADINELKVPFKKTNGYNPINNTLFGIKVELWIIMIFVIISLIYLTIANFKTSKSNNA
jgi:hypothetical protein